MFKHLVNLLAGRGCEHRAVFSSCFMACTLDLRANRAGPVQMDFCLPVHPKAKLWTSPPGFARGDAETSPPAFKRAVSEPPMGASGPIHMGKELPRESQCKGPQCTSGLPLTYSRTLEAPSQTIHPSSPWPCQGLARKGTRTSRAQETSCHGSGPAARTHTQARSQVSAGCPRWSGVPRGPLMLLSTSPSSARNGRTGWDSSPARLYPKP